MKTKRTYFYYKGIKVSDIDLNAVERIIDNILSINGCGYFCLTDVGNVMMAQKDLTLADAINHSSASIADGAPLAWFGKLTGRNKIERVSGVELLQRLLSDTRYHHFLLGDTAEMQSRVVNKAKSINPDARIDTFSPPFKSTFSSEDNRMILKKINNCQPDIIWVCFGGGKQEKWMFEHYKKVSRGIMIGVGAAFKFYTGDLIVPPKSIQRLGLQWTTRLYKNPKRWMTKGPLIWRMKFLASMPAELIKEKAKQYETDMEDKPQSNSKECYSVDTNNRSLQIWRNKS